MSPQQPPWYTLVGLVEQPLSGLIQTIDLASIEVDPVLFPRQPALDGHVGAGIALEDPHNVLLVKPPHVCGRDVLHSLSPPSHVAKTRVLPEPRKAAP